MTLLETLERLFPASKDGEVTEQYLCQCWALFHIGSQKCEECAAISGGSMRSTLYCPKHKEMAETLIQVWEKIEKKSENRNL